MRIALGAKIFALVGGGVVVSAAALGGLAWQVSLVQQGYASVLAGDVAARDAIRIIQAAQRAEVVAWKNVLLRGRDAEDRSTYVAALRREQETVATSLEAVAARLTDPEMRSLLSQFEASHAAHARDYERALEVFVASKGTDIAAADAIVRGKNSASTDTLATMVSRIDTTVHDALASQDARVRSMWWGITLGLAAAFAGFGLLATVLVRSVTHPVSAVSRELLDGSALVLADAARLAAGAGSLAQGTRAQREALEDTTASMDALASTIRATSARATEARRVTGTITSRTDASVRDLGALVTSMDRITASSDEVAGIVRSIDDIARQTNILALNAAVEAARAGDVGMGFAVVAEEVRALAQRAAQSAHHSSTLIEQALSDAREGSCRVSDVSTSVRGIADLVSRVNELVQGVSDATARQTDEIAQVSAAVRRMEETLRTTAESAETSASASRALSTQAERTTVLVRHLGHVIDGGRAAPVPPSVPAWQPPPRS